VPALAVGTADLSTMRASSKNTGTPKAVRQILEMTFTTKQNTIPAKKDDKSFPHEILIFNQ
jgi:hypothetical protein